MGGCGGCADGEGWERWKGGGGGCFTGICILDDEGGYGGRGYEMVHYLIMVVVVGWVVGGRRLRDR